MCCNHHSSTVYNNVVACTLPKHLFSLLSYQEIRTEFNRPRVWKFNTLIKIIINYIACKSSIFDLGISDNYIKGLLSYK